MAEIMLRLDEKSLRRDPAEVFDILEKIGEGYVGMINLPVVLHMPSRPGVFSFMPFL